MGDTSLTSHFIFKEIDTQGPFPSIILLSSFFLRELHIHTFLSLVISLPEKLI